MGHKMVIQWILTDSFQFVEKKLRIKKTQWKLIENLKYGTEREIQISFEYFDSEFFSLINYKENK